MKGSFQKLVNKLTFRGYRDHLLFEQQQMRKDLSLLFDQLFLSNPVLILDGIQIYLPLFYTDHIQKTIYQSRNFYEIETLDFLRLHFRQFEHVIDVGSNIGNHMLFYCRHLQAKKVYCFEPHQLNLEILEKNIALNHLQQTVTVYPVALGEKPGKAIQKNFSLANTGMNRVAVLEKEDGFTESVEMRTLDSFQFENAGFLKIDVEGFEKEVLLGAQETIRRHKPVVLVEVLDETCQEVNELMTGFGYRKLITLKQYDTIYVPL